ncbi:MAG: hypothetical protein R3Y53_08395 [Bacillota bacterium]
MEFRWLQSKNKKNSNLIFLIFLIGIVLLLLGGSLKDFTGDAEEVEVEMEENAPVVQLFEESQEPYATEIERRLADILSKVDGAGSVEVMVTYKSAEEKILAVDSYVEQSGSDESGKEVTYKEEVTTVLIEDENRGTEPFVVSEKMPKVEGVVVVAEGGDNAIVAQGLHNAVQAIFDVEAHKITILKMK